MNLESAILTIRTFWKNDGSFPLGNNVGEQHIARLESDFGRSLPTELHEYVRKYAPLKEVDFATVGNPYVVFALKDLGYKQEGYTYNPVSKTQIDGWNKSHFIFAYDSGDPVILDLEAPGNGVQQLLHGAGSWEFGETIADTIGQFLLCAAAQQHALFNFEEESIVDDDKGFNLAPEAAKWYFPRMKKWAGEYYEEWCSVFNNY